MKTVAEVLGVSRSNLADRLRERPPKRIGRPPLPDAELVAQIKAVIAELPTYGYRRVHAILKRQALAAGLKPPNHKGVYRVMKVHGLLLNRHARLSAIVHLVSSSQLTKDPDRVRSFGGYNTLSQNCLRRTIRQASWMKPRKLRG